MVTSIGLDVALLQSREVLLSATALYLTLLYKCYKCRKVLESRVLNINGFNA
jgi:hypothetical protein